MDLTWEHVDKPEQNYPNNLDIKILISAATAKATINAITFITGHGILLYLYFVLLSLSLLSNPVVYSGNINTVT